MFPGTSPTEFKAPTPPKLRPMWLRQALDALGLCFRDERDFLEGSLSAMGLATAVNVAELSREKAALTAEVEALRDANTAMGTALAELRGQAGPSPEALALTLRPGVIGWSSGRWFPGETQLRLFSCEVGTAGQGYTSALRLAQASRRITDSMLLSRAELCVEVDTVPHDGLLLAIESLQTRVPVCPLDALDWKPVGGEGFSHAARLDIMQQIESIGGGWTPYSNVLVLGTARREGHIRVTLSGNRRKQRMRA